jgi:hypothetical protein
MKNATARLRLIITDCLIFKISKTGKELFKQVGRKSKTHSTEVEIVNLHFAFCFSWKYKKKEVS